MNSKYFTPGIHILIWSILFVIPMVLFHNVPLKTDLPDNFFLLTNIYHVGLFYANAYFLYPRFFNKKTWWLYLLLIAVIIACSYYLKLFFLKWHDPSFEVSPLNDRILFFPPIPFLIASTIFRIIANRVLFERMEKERKAERLASELKFLRSQISPHFLFNVITNMVSLARQKSDLLEPFLLKLADLLRYMLYESGEEKFLVSKEILYLESYIELQQLRFEDIQVIREIKNENADCYMEPMLLIPFVENAFKHGPGMIDDPFIKIRLEVKGNHLFFSVVNNYNKQHVSKDKNSGIGLSNVKNRLGLLYPEKYKLIIEDDGNMYNVQLNIELSC